MAVKIYGNMKSSAFRCVWAAEELGIDYLLVEVRANDLSLTDGPDRWTVDDGPQNCRRYKMRSSVSHADCHTIQWSIRSEQHHSTNPTLHKCAGHDRVAVWYVRF